MTVAGYDLLMRLQSFTVLDPGGNSLLDYAYTYNPTGNIVTKATEHGTYGYDYDVSSRLITADNPVLEDEAYTYDNVGNRLTSADVSGTWNYNANNELLGFADVEYTYDDNGNMTQITIAGSVVWTYAYDAANRLVHVEDGTGSISADYYYDPFGRRLWKEVGGTRTYFFYSDEGLIGEYDASGNELKTYGYRPDSSWTTDPLFMKQGTDYYFYQNDHLGTPQKLVGVNGAVAWSTQYSSFGTTDVQVETVTNNLRFPGQYEDVETGLYYNYFRYYDPKLGRYLRVDPIGFLGGDDNLYTYGGNHPIQIFDSMGLSSHIDPGYPSPGWPQYPPPLEERLEALPRIARVKGWNQLALLFEKWFSLPGHLGREENPPDTSIITMKWVLQFAWAKEVYDRIIQERVYANAASKDRIRTKPWIVGITEDRSTFGTPPPPLGANPQRMLEFDEKHSLNFRQVNSGNPLDPDALYAALANFDFHIIVTKGEKYGSPLSDACLRIDQIGIYVKDSFDFIDDSTWYKPWTWFSQPLGYWNPRTDYAGPNPYGGQPGGYSVTNKSFRDYRQKTGRGGDFFVFSDVALIDIDPPDWIFLRFPGNM